MSKFSIDFPEAGEGATISFSFDDLEKLQEFYPPTDEMSSNDLIRQGLDRIDAATIARVGAVAVKGGEVTAALDHLSAGEIALKLNDAMSLRLYGEAWDARQETVARKTFEMILKHENIKHEIAQRHAERTILLDQSASAAREAAERVGKRKAKSDA